MNIQQYGKLTLAVTLFGALSSQAYANGCGDESPLKRELGNDYYNLDYAPDAQRVLDDDAIEALFHNTEWRSGHGKRYKCFGDDATHRINPTTFLLEDIERINTLNGQMQLTAWENSNRKVASSTLYIAEAQQWLRGPNNNYTSSQLLRRRNLTVRESQFYPASIDLGLSQQLENRSDLWPFKANGHDYYTGGSYIVEITTSVQAQASGLVVTQSYYINGYKGEWFTWTLEG